MLRLRLEYIESRFGAEGSEVINRIKVPLAFPMAYLTPKSVSVHSHLSSWA
jgi:hypothetical protein